MAEGPMIQRFVSVKDFLNDFGQSISEMKSGVILIAGGVGSGKQGVAEEIIRSSARFYDAGEIRYDHEWEEIVDDLALSQPAVVTIHAGPEIMDVFEKIHYIPAPERDIERSIRILIFVSKLSADEQVLQILLNPFRRSHDSVHDAR